MVPKVARKHSGFMLGMTSSSNLANISRPVEALVGLASCRVQLRYAVDQLDAHSVFCLQ
jgi:hypothetical protein